MLTPRPTFGIDLGTHHAIVTAPLRTFFPEQDIDPQHREFITCALNEDHTRLTPVRILLENQDRTIGLASQRNAAVQNFKSNFGYFDQEYELSDKVLESHLSLNQPQYTVGYGQGNSPTTFTNEQITGMYLRKLIQNCRNPGDLPSDLPTLTTDPNVQIGNSRASIVVSVPTYWKQCHKQSLLSAAQIASLSILSLVQDTTAAAVCYVSTRLPSNAGIRDPFYLLIADFGSQSLQTSLFRVVRTFHGVSISALSHTWTLEASGDKITQTIAQHIADSLLKSHPAHADVINNDAKFANRLLSASEKLKIALSASPIAEQTIEILPGEVETSFVMKRETIVELIAPFNTFIKSTVDRCIAEGIQRIQTSYPDDIKDKEHPTVTIHSAELAGAGSRIPSFQSALELSLQQNPLVTQPITLSRTLNSDEAVAWGCGRLASQLEMDRCIDHAKKANSHLPLPSAVKAANAELQNEIPKTVRVDVKDILTHDIVLYETEQLITSDASEPDGQKLDTIQVISKTTGFPSPFVLPENPTQTLVAFQKGTEYPSKHTARFDMRGRSKPLVSQDPKSKLQVLIDARYVPKDAETDQCQPPRTIQGKHYAIPTSLVSTMLLCDPSSDMTGIVVELDKNGQFSLHSPFYLEHINTEQSSIQRQPRSILLFSSKTPKKQIQTFSDEEQRMMRQDEQTKASEIARNDLESYCYSLLNDCSDNMDGCMTEAACNEFKTKVNSILDKINDESFRQPPLIYNQHMKELKDWIEPVLERKKEKERIKEESLKLNEAVQNGQKVKSRFAALKQFFPEEVSGFETILESALKLQKEVKEKIEDPTSIREEDTSSDSDSGDNEHESLLSASASTTAASLQKAIEIINNLHKERSKRLKEEEQAELLRQKKEKEAQLKAQREQAQRRARQNPFSWMDPFGQYYRGQEDEDDPYAQAREEEERKQQEQRQAALKARQEQLRKAQEERQKQLEEQRRQMEEQRKKELEELQAKRQEEQERLRQRLEQERSQKQASNAESSPIDPRTDYLLPKMDMQEYVDAYVYHVELSGAPKEDIQLSLDGEDLIVTAPRKRYVQSNDPFFGFFGAGYMPREEVTGVYKRIVTLPSDADSSSISADFRNGILIITIPRLNVRRPSRRINIF
ncbi:putative Heat shock 70 kDa protein 15 [Blattamonas nauphoetae]|uniref:Heat shock 70 kDa protein 15 n=1 Tax=Blattamonas nauphoetae TaxID=2049346 RepID=A0ABQ9YFC5_9EUKA|nr:putative Heat shock 70 kDa protein 15 [Blattamonas nauphoetae]